MKGVFQDICNYGWGPAESTSRLLKPASIFIIVFCLLCSSVTATVVDLSDPAVRQQQVERLAEKSTQRKAHAAKIAKEQGWPVKEKIGHTIFELMAIDAGRIYAYKTCNVNAAISTATDLVRNTSPYDANGIDLTMGIWDGAAVLTTHQEFGARVTVMDGASSDNHATHVAGTIAAAGVNAAALGMAPNTDIDSYEWNSDVAEMTSRAMSYPNEPGKIQFSNHSYSYICGWEHGYSPPRWYGTWGDRESDFFGIYDFEVVEWDQLCYNAPYFLPFKVAGNDRNDDAPAEGEVFYYKKKPDAPVWRSKLYDSSSDPYGDGFDNGGFDTIAIIGNAKNIMTIGAVDDAVTAGLRDVNQATMATFSGWGPTDDGRIKPDIVTNGLNLYSSTASSDSSYSTYSGTSMATPGASGAAVLLTDYYQKLFPSQAMRSSTLKALIIHTADDLGKPGPDYKFGWGLMNTLAAAEQITDHNDIPDANKIVEAVLDDINTVSTYTFESNATLPIKATLCWTDPPAEASDTLDDTTPKLINDLDLRIIDPNSTSYYPFVLNPADPNATATTGDNTLDNVEQVLIASPDIPGIYTVQVTYKAALTNSQQYYSLIISGQYVPEPLLTDFSGNGTIGYEDLEILVSYWLQDSPSVDIAPPGGDGIINFLDYARFAQDWQ